MTHWNRFAARVRALYVLATLLAATGASAQAAELSLLVQPILSEEQTKKAFGPLCDFIAKRSGHTCTVQTSPNFLAYWDRVRRNQGYDLVLDAAHFTDWRNQKFNFQVLAKIPDSVSYTLISSKDALILDNEELIGKTVATLGPPSIGAARLTSMFPNPVRQPVVIEVPSSEAAIALIEKGRARAAILPTPFVSQQMSRGAPFTVVSTTEPIPHIALSASNRVDVSVRATIQKALLEAADTREGQAMLKAIGFERFVTATADIYAGHSKILKEYWGY